MSDEVKLRVKVKKFYDIQEDVNRHEGDVFITSVARAQKLLFLRYVEIIQDEGSEQERPAVMPEPEGKSAPEQPLVNSNLQEHKAETLSSENDVAKPKSKRKYKTRKQAKKLKYSDIMD